MSARTLRAALLYEIVNDPSAQSEAAHDEWLAEEREGDEWISTDDDLVSVVLDGVEVPFRSCQVNSWWAVRTIRDDVVITAAGKGVSMSDLRLVSVDDLRPYLEGRVDYLRMLRQGGR